MQIPAFIPALDTNVIVIAILVAMGLYGLIAGKQRTRILILSVYVGVVFAEQLADAVSPMLRMLSEGQVSWLLLGLPIVVFGVLGGRFHKGEKGLPVTNIIVGILTGALIVSSALYLLPPSETKSINDSSFIAMILHRYHLWLLGLLPVVAIILGLIKKRENHH
jgi:hypothetical protein